MSNFQKNSKDYGEPDITYQLAGSEKLGFEGNTLPDVFYRKQIDVGNTRGLERCVTLEATENKEYNDKIKDMRSDAQRTLRMMMW